MSNSKRQPSPGRMERIYTFLRDHPRPHGVHAIAEATDDAGEAHITGITLAAMTKKDYATRVAPGRYRVGSTLPFALRPRRVKPPAAQAAPIVRAPTPEAARRLATPIPLTNLQRSAQIAADIAAFEGRGGRIQRLGVTETFRPRRAAND